MTDLPAATATTTADASNALAEQALSILLTHTGSDLLSVESLGRLSIASSTLLSLTQPAWRHLFRKAVSAGSSEYAAETTTYLWRSDTLLNTWAGENGLQSCFATPHPELIQRLPGGYKRAARCLLTKFCAHCGEYAATSNPLTHQRLCDDCTQYDTDGYLILKSRAKSAFLLGERDLKPLEKYSVTLPVKVNHRECETTVYLLSDVRRLAYERWGGRDALANRIDVKEGRVVAHDRVTRRAAKRQKVDKDVDSGTCTDDRRMTRSSNKNKIAGNQKKPYRLFEDDHALRSWIESIPIGVTIRDGCMVGAVECKDCHLRGCLADIALHERLQHGIIHFGFDPEMEFNTEIPADLASFDELDMPKELKTALFTDITDPNREFQRKSALVLAIDGEGGATPMLREMCCCLTNLHDNEITVASDMLRICTCDSMANLLIGDYDEEKGVYKLSCQLEPYGEAMELLKIGIGFDADIFFEAPLTTFDKLTAAFGLPTTELNAARLLASLILTSQPKETFLATVLMSPCSCSNDCAYSKGIPNSDTPVFRTAVEIMKNGFVTSGPLVYVQGAGVADANGYYRYRHRTKDFSKEGRYHGSKVQFAICPTKGCFGPGNDLGWTLRVWKSGPCLYSCKVGDDSVPPKSGWEEVAPLNVSPAPSLTIIA